MKKSVFCLIIILLFCLSACGKEQPAVVEPTIAPTPTPVPMVALPDGREFDLSVTEIDLSSVSGSELPATAEALKGLPQLKELHIGNADERMSAEELAAFMAEFPDVYIDGSFTLLGERRSLNEELELDLSQLCSEQVPELAAELCVFRNVRRLDMGSDKLNDLSFEDVAVLEASAPNAEYSYDFSMYGRDFSVNTKKVNLSHVKVNDDAETVRRALRCMPGCDYLDMDSCGVDNEIMADIRDEFPQIEVIWRVWFGILYSVRTNVDTILASDSYDEGELTNENAVNLKYCTKVKYLDIGHNRKLQSIDFVKYMPELEVLITCDGPALTDISAIAYCPKMEYLELISAVNVPDLEPLAGLTELKHLNICNMPELDDISPLYNCTKLERLWIGRRSVKVPAEQVAEMQRIVPDCVINTTVDNPTDDPLDYGWRYTRIDELLGNVYHPRYELLRKQFRYSEAPYSYSFSKFDPYYFKAAPTPEE